MVSIDERDFIIVNLENYHVILWINIFIMNLNSYEYDQFLSLNESNLGNGFSYINKKYFVIYLNQQEFN